MNFLIKLFLTTSSLCFLSLTLIGQTTQTYMSESWNGQGGILATFYQNHSETDVFGNVYVSGSTINSNNNHDLLLQKFNREGDLQWENTINGQANMEDMAAKFFLDDQGNIYLTGAITNYANSDLDLVVLKYNAGGQLLWEYTYDNPNNQGAKDFGVDITGNNQGLIVVTGASEGESSSFDYITIAIDETTGDMVWRSSYDYLELDDVASVVTIGSSSVYVSGGSQESTSPISWEVATVQYSLTNGNQLSLNRSSGSSTAGLNEINDITINNDTIFLTGRVQNENSGFDIVTYKLDNQLSLMWEQHFDFNNLNDAGNGIKVDSQGNVIVAGYVSDSLELENYCVLKYDNNGTLLWTKTYNGQFNGNDRAVQLVIDNQDNIFVTGSSMNNTNLDYLTIGLDSTGSLICEAIFDGINQNDDVPNTITIDNDNNLIVVGQSEHQSGVYNNTTVKYSMMQREKVEVLPINGDDPHIDNNIILRFDKSKLNLSSIDKKGFVAGELSQFVDSNFIDEMNDLTSFDWERLNTYKIYFRATTEDTISISRLGDTIPLTDFWASLVVEIPDGFDEKTICDTLVSLFGVHRAQLNYVYSTTNAPDDAFYVNGYQLGLHPNSIYPDADIDVEGAWEIIDNAGGQKGDNDIKVGIYDHLIDYSHMEFGHGGTLQGSKVIGGYNFVSGSGTSDISDANQLYNGHGTKVAGIIGAHRNEAAGIAGIAGGDLNQNPINNSGVQLFSAGLFYNSQSATSEIVANAFVEGSSSTNADFGFGLDIANHSYGREGSSDEVVLEAVKLSWKNNTINVVSRGKSENNNLEFPACYGDKYLINVMASGEDGKRMNVTNGPGNWSSPYGIPNAGNTQACYVDVMAPGVSSLISTTTNQLDNSAGLAGCLVPSEQNGSNYACFNGTSAAAAHVTGVAALMYSTHDPDEHWDYKNKLAIEDVEHVLEKTTADGPHTYSDNSAYGLVDAKEAVKQVTRPYTVRHQSYWGNNANLIYLGETEGLNDNGINMWYFDEDFGIVDGSSVNKIKKYRIIFDLDFIPAGNNEIIDWWETKSRQLGGAASKNISSTIQTIFNYDTDDDWFDVNLWIDYINNKALGSATTYCYKIYPNSSSNYFWYPMHPDYIHYTYTLHLKDNTTGLYDVTSEEENISIFPNPSGGIYTLSWNDRITINKIMIYDIKGVLCKESTNVSGHSEEIDISNLNSGVYYIRLLSNSEIYTKKVIKN